MHISIIMIALIKIENGFYLLLMLYAMNATNIYASTAIAPTTVSGSTKKEVALKLDYII